MLAFKDIKVGDKIQFVYDTAANPDTIRTVTVTKVVSNKIYGYDDYTEGHRTFIKNKMRFLQTACKVVGEQLRCLITTSHTSNLRHKITFMLGYSHMHFYVNENNIIFDDVGHSLDIEDIESKFNNL